MQEADLARLHQAQQLWDKRQRFVCRWTEGADYDPRRRLANQMQNLVREMLEQRGYVVAGTRHQENYDLLVQGVRVEAGEGG